MPSVGACLQPARGERAADLVGAGGRRPRPCRSSRAGDLSRRPRAGPCCATSGPQFGAWLTRAPELAGCSGWRGRALGAVPLWRTGWRVRGRAAAGVAGSCRPARRQSVPASLHSLAVPRARDRRVPPRTSGGSLGRGRTPPWVAVLVGARRSRVRRFRRAFVWVSRRLAVVRLVCRLRRQCGPAGTSGEAVCCTQRALNAIGPTPSCGPPALGTFWRGPDCVYRWSLAASDPTIWV